MKFVAMTPWKLYSSKCLWEFCPRVPIASPLVRYASERSMLIMKQSGITSSKIVFSVSILKGILSTDELMSKDHAEFAVFLGTMKILLTKTPGSRSHCAIAFMSKGSEVWFLMVTLLSGVKGSWREG